MAVDMAALKAKYPDYGIINAVEAPGGGFWAIGADGGVFALEGAPFLGSYWTLDATQRQGGARNFVDIQRNAATGGYTLISKNHETYDFVDRNKPKPNEQTATPPSVGDPGATTVNGTAVTIRAMLDQLKLGNLFDDAWKYYLSMGTTASVDAVAIWMRGQTSFKERFPAMDHLEQKGEYWTPGQYLEYERKVTGSMRDAGIPADFWDSADDFANLIRNDWSADEVTDAVQQAQAAQLTMPPETRDAMQKYYGISAGDLTAFYLDPDKKGRTLLERKAQAAIASIGGAGTKAGFDLSQTEANQLFQAGLSDTQAGAALDQQFEAQDLTKATLDESSGLDRSTIIGAAARNKADQAEIDRRTQARQARFSGGGGAQGVGQGRSGLG